jgi:hypothetical protein
VRDATDFTPTGKKPWWQELPPAGESAWAERAARRKGRIDFRLAFVASKFRVGPEPEPFAIELYLPKNEPWTLRDVTNEIEHAANNAQSHNTQTQKNRLQHAATKLAEEVKERHSKGKAFYKTAAEQWLQNNTDLTQEEAREVVEDEMILWELKEVRRLGNHQSKILVPKIGNHNHGE